MNFADLKKSNVAGLVDELNKREKKNNFTDARFWKSPQRDESGNAQAIIRFLPTTDGAGTGGLPWTDTYSHYFQGPGGWYIENSLTTLGKDDPCGELNSELWATEVPANRSIVRKRSRRHHYISNILVIKDASNPDNEGKVFLYKYGVKIFEKIKSAMSPEFDDVEAIDPFCFWKGANFRLKVRTVDKYPNYDASTFDAPKAISDDDDELEAIWKKQFSLEEFTDPKNFKEYDVLKKRLDKVLGMKSSDVAESPTFSKEDTASQNEASPPAQAMLGAEAPTADDEDEEDLMATLTKLGSD